MNRLQDIVGKRAFTALTKGRYLEIWRQSSPHNWFIEKADGSGFLWHSHSGSLYPSLWMFDCVSKGTKGEMHGLYVLKEEFRSKI
jgi:predicted dehydrogenase